MRQENPVILSEGKSCKVEHKRVVVELERACFQGVTGYR